ncbi:MULTISPECIES: isopentenyl phosphate kinase [Nostocales]|uniref:Isopentenyl phosphate kinase n=3 Tax=Nostocales TaxID=1161 RepID=A0A0C1RJI8_9CYAN|nr:isopentenyl phosphate kinase [Tolypothrix bouteillei]KAF3890508.1 isopentenyl phosphate kinase family protein [Tolypothrix bouteillei VB521301]
MALVLIKLGGSLITDKEKPYTARPEVMQRLAREIHYIRAQNPNLKLIIGNGAGSFGHQSAKKYNTIEGFVSPSEKMGFCLVHQDVLDLNLLLAKIFLQTGLPVVSLPPVTMVVTENQKLIERNFSCIDNSLATDLIPLVFGDVVLDKEIGGTILSTDTLLAELAKYFLKQNQDKIILINAGDYPGVRDRKGDVISLITKSNYCEIETALGLSHSVDVTGGMKKKVEEFLAISSLGIDCWILDGSIPENLVRAVLGKPTSGTLIRAF